MFDVKDNITELNKQAADINKKIPQESLNQQIILDGSINSETKEVMKENKISKEIKPFKKPTGLSDLSDKMKKLKGG